MEHVAWHWTHKALRTSHISKRGTENDAEAAEWDVQRLFQESDVQPLCDALEDVVTTWPPGDYVRRDHEWAIERARKLLESLARHNAQAHRQAAPSTEASNED